MSTATVTDKLALVAESGQLEGQLAQWEADQAKAEQDARSARTGRNIGGVGILVGIIGLLIFWPLLFIGVAGLLAYVTQHVKAKDADARAEAASEQIKRIRSRQAELRAMLAVA